MRLDVFDVEHGACALLICENGTRLMIDCGRNTTTGWAPGTYLRNQGATSLDMLAITNYDEDHADGLPNLLKDVEVKWLWRNPSVTPETIKRLKSEDGMGRGIETLVEMAQRYTGGEALQQPIFAGLERRAFYNNYPEFDDENNLSMALHLKCNGTGVLFTGDLERAGWLKLLERQDFRAAVADTAVLIASHHGRESGICEEIFDEHDCHPFYVVVSDKGYQYDTQKTCGYYGNKTRGGPFRGETRHVLTTRKDGSITFSFASDRSWGPS